MFCKMKFYRYKRDPSGRNPSKLNRSRCIIEGRKFIQLRFSIFSKSRRTKIIIAQWDCRDDRNWHVNHNLSSDKACPRSTTFVINFSRNVLPCSQVAWLRSSSMQLGKIGGWLYLRKIDSFSVTGWSNRRQYRS